jgi:hypothetical protein
MENLNPSDIPATPDYIMNDDFEDNRYGWEIVSSTRETAIITPKGYQLENKDKDRWHHFSLFPEIDSLKDIVIKCRIEVDVDSGLGQVGIIWGFDKSMTRLNKFCLSAQGKGCSIAHFEKNHRPIFHRFYDPFIDSGLFYRSAVLEIREANGYWFFRVNKQLVYIAHQIHFAHKGVGLGFYLDPGVIARVKKLHVYRRPVNKAFSSN